jgi:hypothetical protein
VAVCHVELAAAISSILQSVPDVVHPVGGVITETVADPLT